MRSSNILRYWALILLLTCSSKIYAQEIEKGYFLFPIKPGQQNYLSGNMGEMRTNHFHAGLDIKTDQRTGLPVYAAADGYISRLKVASYGYGNVLYMLHPNGMTTVYGHLLKFTDTISNYVREAQHRVESFEIELFPDHNQLYFKKGDIIAYSGNSGSSGGPHLHFEIRDKNQWVLNPLKFGFTEIKDNLAPVLTNIEVKAMDINSRVDGEFGPNFYRVSRSGNKYFINDTIRVHGPIGLGIMAYDVANSTSNHNGVSKVECLVDGKQVYLNDIFTYSFASSRYINRHMDYHTYKMRGHRYQKLYVEPDNELGFYTVGADRGILNFAPGTAHTVVINMWDALDNLSTATLNIKAVPFEKLTSNARGTDPPNQVYYLTYDNVLKVVAKNSTISSSATIYTGASSSDLPIAYNHNREAVYLWDLRAGLPDSIDISGAVKKFHFVTNVLPGQKTTYKNESVTVSFGPNDVYDTLYLEVEKPPSYPESYYQQVQVGDPYTPFRTNVEITMRPDKPIPDYTKAAVYKDNGKWLSHEGGTWNDGQITFRTRDLGTFVIADDDKDPYIKVLAANSGSLRFNIGDAMSGLESFRATVNDKWVLMNYDHKRNLIWNEESGPFSGDFKLVIKDRAGNEKIYQTKL